MRLDDRYFDTSGMLPMSSKLRCQIAQLMTSRANRRIATEKRLCERVDMSLVAPAIQLDSSMNPVGLPLQFIVANLSRQGIGLVHNGPIRSQYLALKLTPDKGDPIQVVVRVVRQQILIPPFFELGGQFYVRLGSTVETESQEVFQGVDLNNYWTPGN
ncbi:MAG: hypothetical protein MI725_05160 [Pirellulales bacterium]|nr:hypothetical protein [Pirellulales bacterium]